MAPIPLIALDGPSGVGKSSTAKALAHALGWEHMDTGAMYRAAALALQRAGTGLEDAKGLARVLAGLDLLQLGSRIYLHGEDVTLSLRSMEVDRLVTPVSADPRVREVLVEQQRRIGRQGGFVVDGRDICTVVFPDACCKIFLTATVEARARRRFLEGQARGGTDTLEAVAADIERRDLADSTRAVAPLRRAEDAILVDSSDLSLDQVVARILDLHRAHG
jgi:cytidylate kinase